MLKHKLDTIRYSYDNPSNFQLHINNPIHSQIAKRSYITNGLSISKDLLPDIKKIIDECCNITGIENDFVSSYVYSSEELNASCIFSGDRDCVLAISSGLIKLLDLDELKFIIGHEIGHAIYRHNFYPTPNKNSTEFDLFKLLRAAEISADRIGYICCESEEVALRSMIKLSSGLDEKYLNFNFQSFVNQTKELSVLPVERELVFSTHPPLILRARALMWFSMTKVLQNNKTQNNNMTYKKVDDLIYEDLSKFIDNIADLELEKAINNFRLWLFVFGCASDKKFTLEEQSKFKKHFDKETITKLLNYLSNIDSEEILNHLKIKCSESYDQLIIYNNSNLNSIISEVFKWFEDFQDSKLIKKFLENELDFITTN